MRQGDAKDDTGKPKCHARMTPGTIPSTPKGFSMSDRDLIRQHFKAMLAEASAAGMRSDAVGRMLLDEIIALWLRERRLEDVEAELRYTLDNLDPDQDYTFMRP